MTIMKMTDLNLKDKRILMRVDFNVPIENGKITSEARIQAALTSIEYARDHNARILLISHLGRPEPGKYDEKFSMSPIAKRLSVLLKQKVRLESNWIDGVELDKGEIVLGENVRFLRGETENDEALALKMANLADIFVMDAFGVAHRVHASTYGVAKLAPVACAGPLLVAELEALSRALTDPIRPVVAIVGGSKVSTKLTLLSSLFNLTDRIILGGGLINTFLAAKGLPIGRSLHEPELISEAKLILANRSERLADIPLPTDVIVAKEMTAYAEAQVKDVTEVADDDLILDIGPETAQKYSEILVNAGTIIWNGPVGVFEYEPFSSGTKALAMAISDSPAFSIAGGGDTIAAIEKFGIADKVSYISTGGGAFLKFLEGKKLPAVAVLEERGLAFEYR